MAGVAGLGTLGGLHGMALAQTDLKRLTILHTNDTHSRIDPFPANDPGYPGMGGYARRAALINQFRQSDPELLLLDAGDFFQGTPYFNKYGGETELVLMSHLGYDAATLGNHEFDNGLEGLLHVLPHARFPFVCSNYDFSDTVLRDKTLPYLVLERNGVSVGIYGLGISLDGLVARHHFGNTVVLDPIEVAREMESTLKRKGCDLILCISHLGFRYEHDRVSDYILAGHTRETDIIIGGHTHRRLDPAEVVRNESGREVTIGQAGSAGVFLGRMVVYFEPDTGEKLVESNTTNISKNQVV
jgi:5'-nucleotidase